jgi:hypothetical protein
MTLLDQPPAPLGEEGPHESPLPRPRGPRSEHLLAHLTRRVHDLGPLPPAEGDPIDGEDTPLSLHLLYELHYRGVAGVDERWEWDPGLLQARSVLEEELEQRLVDEVGPVPVGLRRDDALAELDRLADGTPETPSLSAWMLERGRLEHVREFAVHRSIYQLKEADPHTFGIPRLHGRAKAAMVEIQKGEYGDGDPSGVHAALFAQTMRHLGLDDRYGAYLDDVPGVTLATGNLISLFGLHRRWRGALVGHLALFEMSSVTPMGRYAATLRRLGLPDEAARFYDEHVAADAHHEVVARDDLAGGLLDDEPILGGELAFGARALGAVEARFSQRIMAEWEHGRSSLRHPLRRAAHPR